MGDQTGPTGENDAPLHSDNESADLHGTQVSSGDVRQDPRKDLEIEIVEGAQGADPALPPNDDLERAHKFAQPFARFMQRWRVVIKRWPWLDVLYKIIITIIGVVVILVGIILIPLPGPGWLIVFIGLTILGSEFHWARRLTNWARLQLARFWERWLAYRAQRAEKKAEKLAQKEARRAAAEETKRSRGV